MIDALPPLGARVSRVLGVFTVLSLACALTACGGPQRRTDKVAAPPWQSHLERVPADASLVLSVNNIDAVTADVRNTSAWERIFEYISKRAPHMSGLRATIEELADVLERDLKGRITIAIWKPDPDRANRRWLVLSDGRMQSVVRGVEQLAREPAGQLVHVGDDVFQYTRGESGPNDAYLLQTPSLGLLSGDRETLAAAVEPAADGLSSSARFGGLVASVDHDAELLFWMDDWSDADESWADMANLAASEPRPRAAMLSVSVDGGLRGRYAFEFDAERADALALPHLKAAEGPLRTPRLLPATTVVYAGLQTSGPSFAVLAEPLLRDAPPDAAVMQELLDGLEGELAFAITEASPDAPMGALGFSLPEAAVLARIREGVDPSQLEPLVASMLRIAHQEMTGTPDMGPPSSVQIGESTVHSYTTADPNIQVAYATVDGFLVVGTASAVTAIATTAGGPAEKSLAAGGDTRAAQALTKSWNYVALVDFGASYLFVKEGYGPMIGMMTDGLVGGQDDLLEFLFSIVPNAGVTLGFEGERILGEFWFTARDAR
jgi:hypothetical protein